MVLDDDDLKTDLVLAAVPVIFGTTLRGFITAVPGYPRSGLVAAIFDLGWLFAMTALVPIVLARYRGDGWSAFGLQTGRGGLRAGVLLALPLAAGGILTAVAAGQSTMWWAGRLGDAAAASDPTTRVILTVQMVVIVASATLLLTFLANRAAGLSRSPAWRRVRLIRTLGMPAVLVGALAGSLRALGGWPLLAVVVQATAVALFLLMVERRTAVDTPLRRSAVIVPAAVIAVLHVYSAGGLFRGDLLASLYTGGLAVAVTVGLAVVATSRRIAWAVLPIVVALHWWPTCWSPIAMRAAGVC